jgi:hypothetical protein
VEIAIRTALRSSVEMHGASTTGMVPLTRTIGRPRSVSAW